MDAKSIRNIESKIYRQFPEVSGARPTVKSQASAKGRGNDGTYLLTFKGSGSGGGRTFARTVRVVASGSGKIIKVSTSR